MFFAPLCVVSVFPVVVFVPIAPITASVNILREYPRAVVFTLGRLQNVKRSWPCPVDYRLQGNGARALAHPGHPEFKPTGSLVTTCQVDEEVYFNVVDPR